MEIHRGLKIDSLRAKAQRFYKKQLDAIDIVAKMLEEDFGDDSDTVTVETPGKNGSSPKRKASRRSHGAVIGILQDILTNIHGEFTIKDVDVKLKEMGKDVARGSFKAALARLAELGETELVKMGAGRRPSVYRKK